MSAQADIAKIEKAIDDKTGKFHILSLITPILADRDRLKAECERLREAGKRALKIAEHGAACYRGMHQISDDYVTGDESVLAEVRAVLSPIPTPDKGA